MQPVKPVPLTWQMSGRLFWKLNLRTDIDKISLGFHIVLVAGTPKVPVGKSQQSIFHITGVGVTRADSRLASSQWEMSLQSNGISHWLGAFHSIIFPVFQNYQNTIWLLNIMPIFGRYHRSLVVVIPGKYECDSKTQTITFAWSKIVLIEKLTNRALVTPTPGPLCSYWWLHPTWGQQWEIW